VTAEDSEQKRPGFGNPAPGDLLTRMRERTALPPLPLPEIATFLREDFDLPLVYTACESLADCAGD
jgi:hypothetical protein